MKFRSVFALCFLLVAVVPLRADDAFMVPRSNRVIKGILTLPDGSKVGFVVRDGTWVTVEDTQAHYFFGFSGVMADEANPNFQLYRITRTGLREEHVDQVGKSTDVQVGKVQKFEQAKGFSFSVAVTGVDEWSFAASPVDDPSLYSALELQRKFTTGGGVCCVTCGSRTLCATSVTTDCGTCGGGGGGLSD